MTREEAIDTILQMDVYSGGENADEALIMAVEALRNVESCKDAVSREAAIDAMQSHAFCDDYDEWIIPASTAISVLRYLPSADAIPVSWIESQIDKGKWRELVQRWRETGCRS